MFSTRYAAAPILGAVLLLGAAPAALAQVPTTPPPPPAPTSAPTPAPDDHHGPPAPSTNPSPVTTPVTAAPGQNPNAGPTGPVVPTEYGAGMKFNLSPDGTKYVRILNWHQVWTRWTENNTGTLRAPGKPQDSQLDFTLRRSRLLILSQLNPRFLIYTHLGINNQTAVSGGFNPTQDGKKPQVFIHEAVVEYKLNKYVSLGGGIHYQNGLSRLTRSSTLNFLTLDAPLTNWPVIEAIDQFARGLGVYAKGRVSRLDYAFSVNESMLTNQTGAFSTPLGLGIGSGSGAGLINTGNNTAQYNPQGTAHIYQGYTSWSVLDLESNLLPFNVGTYLGTKRVLNFGGGFFYNPDGMVSRPQGDVLNASQIAAASAAGPASFSLTPVRTHDIGLWSLDAFFDTPVNKEAGTAFTFYGVYYNFDFGPNHVRYIGAANPGWGAAALRGNAEPQSGTGQAFFGETGFLLPKNLLGPKVRVQPYTSYLLGAYEGLRAPDGTRQNVNIFDVGSNFYLDAHNAKFTLNYRARPDFSQQTALPTGGVRINSLTYRPEVTLQMQVFL